jgi:hypothetical protein
VRSLAFLAHYPYVTTVEIALNLPTKLLTKQSAFLRRMKSYLIYELNECGFGLFYRQIINDVMYLGKLNKKGQEIIVFLEIAFSFNS